jgi:two-component system phosphate regulon sensor histidine kinase PhoR
VLSSRNLIVRLLAPYLFTLVAVAASLYVYSDRAVEDLYFDTLSATVLRQAHLAGELLPWDLEGAPMDARCGAVGVAAAARVTVIGADGVVRGDSEASSAEMENHSGRPEIEQAMREGEGSAVRVSATVKRPLFYLAWRQMRGGDEAPETRVVRLAVSMTTIADVRHRIRAAIWGGFVIAALAALWPALVIARRLSRRVTRLTEFSRAVTEGQAPPPLVSQADDVVGELESNLLSMAQSLSAELRAAQDETGKLEAVLRGMVEGVLVIDESGTIRLANDRARSIFGRSTLVGEPLINVSRDPDLREVVRAAIAGSTGQPAVREMTLNGGRGESLQVTATPITESDEVTRLFILVFHDVTELKKLEATRRDFVANVSHELRTPLTAIRGYAETLQAGAIDDPELARKFVGVIERHSERLSRLTDDLLTLSDLELGRMALQRVPVNLAGPIDAAVELVREKAGQGQIEIVREIPAGLPSLWVDRDRLEQVLVNLIDNAVKYTPAGGRVTLSAGVVERPESEASTQPGREPGQGPWVEIRISDTGIGIPSQDLPRLTERFYRVDKARSRELGGTGLGLAIVKHIVQAHGGVLRIESEVGKGTTVRVILPAVTLAEG